MSVDRWKIGILLALVVVVLVVLRSSGFIGFAPPGTKSYCEQANYVLDVSGDSLKGEVDLTVRPFRRGEFALLSSQVALTALTVNGKERPVVEKNGFYVIYLRSRRESIVRMEFVKNVETAEHTHRLELTVPRASKNRLELRGIRGQYVVLNGLGFNEFESEDMPETVSLFLPPTPKIDIVWQRSKSGTKRARLFARRYTLVEVKDNAMHYRTICDYHIRDGKTSALRWLLDKDCREIKASGAGVHFTKVEKKGGHQVVRVDLSSPITGEYRLELSYSIACKDNMGDVLTGRPAEILNEDEYIAVGSREELQIVPIEETAVTKVPSDRVPSELVSETDIPMFNVYHRTDRGGRLRLSFMKYGEAEGIETAVDKAEYEVYFSPCGKEIVRATFQVRNTHHQFMPLRLAKGTTLCSVYSMDKPVKPLHLKDGTVLIPLEKSIEGFSGYVTFPIDICYILAEKARPGEEVSASLPALGVPTSYLKWSLILPRDSRIKWRDMNVDRVSQFADERTAFALEYARVRAADGRREEEIGIEVSGSPTAFETDDAMEIVATFGEVDKKPPADQPAMPGPQSGLVETFEDIDFGALYRKVTAYSKKMSKSKTGWQEVDRVSVKKGKGGYDYDVASKGQKGKAAIINKLQVKKELAERYSREAQKAYRGGRLEQAKVEVSRALESNIASEQALQLAENVQSIQDFERRGKEARPQAVTEISEAQGSPDLKVADEKLKAMARYRQQESRIQSQVETYRKGGKKLFLWSGKGQGDVQAPARTRPPVALGRDIRDAQQRPAPPKRKRNQPLLLRYNVLAVPNDLSENDGALFPNRAEISVMNANPSFRNWTNTKDFSALNTINPNGYNRMNVDRVQEDTLVDMINDSYGAGNILASNVVKMDENDVFTIPFATSHGTRNARVRPVIVDGEYIDLYVSLPRLRSDGEFVEEETAVRIKRGQTAVLGGISGAAAGKGEDAGLVFTFNSDIMEKMDQEEIEAVYTRRHMDIAVPSGNVYKFEKLLVKANEVLTITMEERK